MNGMAVGSGLAKADNAVGHGFIRWLMALVLLLGSIGMAPARAEAVKTTGVNLGDFVARFNKMATQLRYPYQIDTSFIHDNGGEHVVLTGALGDYATLAGTVSRENNEVIGVIVTFNVKDRASLAEGASMAYAAMAAAAGTTVEALVDELYEELKKGGTQKTYGQVQVKVQELGKQSLRYSAGVAVVE